MNQETILYEIELPAPSETIKNLMYEIYRAHFVTNTGIRPYYKGDDVRVSNLLNIAGVYEHLELSRQVRREYSTYFPGIEISGYFGIFQGDYEDSGLVKLYNPHIDITRCANLNYYFELGGPDVQTWFYDHYDDDDNRITPVRFDDSAPTPLGYKTFQANTWYMFNGGIQAHSVENILGLRMFVGINLLPNDSEKIKLYDDPTVTDEYITNSAKPLERSPYKCDAVLTRMEQSGINCTKLNLTT